MVKLYVIDGNRKNLEIEVLKATFLVRNDEEFRAIAARLKPRGRLAPCDGDQQASGTESARPAPPQAF